MRRTLLRRTLPPTVAALSLAVALSACGNDADQDPGGQDPGGETTSASPVEQTPSLTTEQADAALLSAPDLGAGWVEEPPAGEEDDPIPGCIGELDALTELGERPVEVKKTYSFESGLPQVSSSVDVWASEDDLVEVFDRIETTIDQCDTFEYSEEGATFRITLEPETDIAVEGVDDQNGFTASGTITEDDGEQYPIHLHMARFRVGTNVATLTTTGSEEESAVHAQYARTAAERLVSAVDQP